MKVDAATRPTRARRPFDASVDHTEARCARSKGVVRVRPPAYRAGLNAARPSRAAFEALVRRHGPVVLATCRGVLRHEHDAEDAFQTTFLVLARRAGSLRSGDRLGPWLHRVAVRASERARAEAARRREREAGRAELAAMPPPGPEWDAEREELERVIHQEVNRLPARYRLVVVLCDLERELTLPLK
jgi:RNA polymerase sigma factor (sigma-70 family)